MKTSISVTGATTDDSILDFFFPNFVLTLRDVTLDTKTPDLFLEDKLTLKRGNTDSITNYNEPRQLIRRYFKKRKCFIFRTPVEHELLSQLMKISERELKPEFQDQLDSFRAYIFSCEPKTLKSGKGINGRMLAVLLTSYVTSIQNGESPCLRKAMETMTEAENKRAVEVATKVYDEEMKKRIAAYNTPSDIGLENFHKDSMKVALESLKTGLVFGDDQLYQEKALVIFKANLRKFKSGAMQNSRELCMRRLQALNLNITKKIKNDTYCHPAGYDEYIADIEMLIKRYNKEVRYLGTQAQQTLQEFLDGKEEEEGKVYEMVLKAQKNDKVQNRPLKQSLILLIGGGGLCVKDEPNTVSEDEEIANAIGEDVAAMRVGEIKNVGDQYFAMMTLKMKDMERAQNELSDDNAYYKSIKNETEYWQELSKHAPWTVGKERTESKETEEKKRKPCTIL